MDEHGPGFFDINKQLKSINSELKGMGCKTVDGSLFDAIDRDEDYINTKKYERFRPGAKIRVEGTLKPVKIKGKNIRENLVVFKIVKK